MPNKGCGRGWHEQILPIPEIHTTSALLFSYAPHSRRARRGISMPRGKNCRETICVSQLPRNYSHRGGNLERRKKKPLLWGRGNLGGILRDNLGEGNCESKIAARQWGVNFCREASRCLARLSGHFRRDLLSSKYLWHIFDSDTYQKGAQIDFRKAIFAVFWALSVAKTLPTQRAREN